MNDKQKEKKMNFIDELNKLEKLVNDVFNEANISDKGYDLSNAFYMVRHTHEAAIVQARNQFKTYSGEVISLCDNCPQFKNGKQWEISQCNACQSLNSSKGDTE